MTQQYIMGTPRTLCTAVLFFTTIWGALLIVISILKIDKFGALSFFEHFTNWSWSLQALFYFVFGLTSACTALEPVRRCCVVACFFPVTAIVWAVAIGVQAMLLTDDSFIDILIVKYEAGLVIVGNDVYHMWPVIALGAFAALNFGILFYSFYRLFRWTKGQGREASLYNVICCTYQLVIGPFAVFGLYLIVLAALGTTIERVYLRSLPVEWAVVGFIVVGVTVNGILLGSMVCCCGVMDSTNEEYLESRRYETDFEMLTRGSRLRPIPTGRRYARI